MVPSYFLAFLCAAVMTPSVTQANADELSAATNKFSMDFYKVASQIDNGNLIMSPLSAQTVLALVAQGARGNTESQLIKGLYISSSKDQSATDFKSLMTTLNSHKGITLEIANKVYTMEGFRQKPLFRDVAKRSFLADSDSINFADSESSAKTINKWVEAKTHNRIKNLMNPDTLDGNTRMVLVNAVYFKGDWERKFDPARTMPKPFYTSETESKAVPAMHQRGTFFFAYLENLNAKVIQLPYKDSRLSMMIFLPDSRTGLDALEKGLQEVDLRNIYNEMGPVKVDLTLPKFKIESAFDLKPILKKLGMTDMFDDELANFTEILDRGTSMASLYVSEAVQKSFIEVNEEGAEAAAATSVGWVSLSASTVEEKRHSFVADHPFFFVVRKDADTLFVGRINSPN